MTDLDNASATAFIPPASDPVVNTSTAAFSPPASDPVIATQSSQSPAFTPPDEDAAAAEVLGRIDKSTPKELADDHTFNPASVVAQYHTALSPEQIDKLAEAYHSQRNQHMTLSDVGRATQGVPGALKDFVVGAFKLAKRVPSVVGQAAYNVGGGSTQQALESGDPELQKQAKESSEAFAGLESGTTSLAHLIFKDQTDGKKEFNPDTARTRLFNDAAYLGQQNLVNQGEGEVAKGLAMDADTFAKQGVQLDPKVIEQLSSVENPINWVPILAGAKIASLSNGTFQVLNKIGIPIASAATRKAAETVVEWSAKKVAQAGEKLAGSGTGLAKLAGVSHVIHGGGLTGLATAAAVKAGATAIGKTIQAAGTLASNPKVYSPLLDFAAGAAKGTAAGTALGVPIAALSDTPQEAADALVSSAGFGAAGGAVGAGISKVKQASLNAVQHVVAAHFATAPSLQPVNNYVLPNANPALQSQHQAALSTLQTVNPFAANLINRYRAAMAVKGVPSYLLSPEDAVKLNPALADKEGAFNLDVPTATGDKPGLVWVLGKDGVKSLGHEVGHFIDKFLLPDGPNGEPNPEKEAINKATSGDFQSGFNKHYLESSGLTEAQRKSLTPEQLQAELRAEIFSGLLEGADFKNVPPTIQEKSLGVASRLLERLGLYQPGVAEGSEAPNVSQFGTKQSPIASALSKEVVNRWLQDPQVQSALNGINKEPAPPAPQAAGATPGEAITAQPAIVTPAHEKVLELLKSKISTDELNSWNAIRDKIQKGEALTPTESQDWGKLDEVAQNTPPEILAAKETPVPATIESAKPTLPEEVVPPKPEEIKPAKATIPPEIPNLRVTRKDQNAFENTPERTDIGIQDAATAVEKSTPEQKQVFQTLREALRAPQGQVKPVEIVHSSVEPVEETPGGTRTKRRGEQEAQETRKEYQKLIIPDGFNVTKEGKVQLRAVSPDKVLANARQIVANKKAEGILPYEVVNGKFTEASAHEFNNDLEQYWVNQAAGFKGDGSPLTRPEGHGGFIPSENNQGQVKPIDAAKVDFLNLVQGIAPPKTARVNLDIQGKKIKPVNVRAYELAKANSKEPMKPGVIRTKDIEKQTYEDYGNQQISEFNPLRKKLDEAGVPTRELLEATERLNLEDIKQAVSRPENRLRAPVTDVTAAGFLPSRETPGAKGESAKQIDPEWRVSVQKEPSIPNFPGYVQIDDVSGGVNRWSKSPKTLRAEGYDIPDSIFETVPQGRYKLGDLVNGKTEAQPQAKPRFNTDKTQFQPVTTKTEKQAKGNEDVRRIASDYVRESGLPFAPHTGNQEINEPLAKRIASFYDSAKHEPNDPEVKSAYSAFVQETKDQYRHLTSEGYKMEPWTGKGQPYKNSAEMSADVRDNKHLWYFPTEGGFGSGTEPKTHPLLESSGVKVGNRDIPVNDLFRAVHDVLGHSAEGYEFGPRGELNAFRAHAAMYSEEARPAMAAETLGQNSWVNFGEHLRDESGNVAKKGEPGHVPLTERPFAEQKATVLPKGMIDAVMNPSDERAVSPAIRVNSGKSGEKVFSGWNHTEASEQAHEAGYKPSQIEEGYLSSKGRFVPNSEADQIQPLAKFLPKKDEKTVRLFHGSPVDFKEPRLGRPGTIWLTKDRAEAERGYARGGRVHEFDAKLGKVADLTTDSELRKKLAKIYNADSEIKSDSGRHYTSGKDADTILLNSADVLDYLQKNGFESAKAFETDENGPVSYAVFDTKQLTRPESQFLPSKEPRAVRTAAIRDEEGNVFEGAMHVFAHIEAARANKEGPWKEGFVTNNGEFLDREQALERAIELGQYKREKLLNGRGETRLESNAFNDQQAEQQFQPKRLNLTHFSQTEGLEELDPALHGTGYPGAERKRKANYAKIYPARTYFGMEGYKKEPGLGNNRYRTSVPAKDVYDFQSDPDDLYPTSYEIEKAGYAPMDNGAKVTLYEKRIKDAGYKGYFNQDAKAVAIFDKTPVKSDGLQFMPSKAKTSPSKLEEHFSTNWFDNNVDFSREGASRFKELPYSGTQCTGFACAVYRELGPDRVKIYGYEADHNPKAELGVDSLGHDFAVVDDKYIVDGWARDLDGKDKAVYDLKEDAKEVEKLYGPRDNWEHQPKIEKIAASDRKDWGDWFGDEGTKLNLDFLPSRTKTGSTIPNDEIQLTKTGTLPAPVKSDGSQFMPVTKTASSKSIPNEDIRSATKTRTQFLPSKERDSVLKTISKDSLAEVEQTRNSITAEHDTENDWWTVSSVEGGDYWIVQKDGDKWRAENDGSLTPKRSTREESIQDAKQRIFEELESERGVFGNNYRNQRKTSELFQHFSLPSEVTDTGWTSSKWGSWYNTVTLSNGDTLKLSIRDHEPARKDMGLPDKYAEVSKEWTPEEVSNALSRLEDWVASKEGVDMGIKAK